MKAKRGRSHRISMDVDGLKTIGTVKHGFESLDQQVQRDYEDLVPPTLVTFIKDVLQAIIANELHARMMKSYVAHFRRRQSVTDLAHINSQFCHAQVAWVSRFPVSWRGVGHGLHAIF